ncbi:MAG: hypothetical protein JXR76_24005 [Deltaproteobacteria bacterium]|nr:hypothetical protein [Deltaproteobacteria bacterium]
MTKDTTEIDKFWTERAKSLGEPILEKNLVHVIQCNVSEIRNDSWCLGILTPSRLIIQRGETQNWFSHMLQSNITTRQALQELIIPRESLMPAVPLIPSGFIGRLIQRTKVYRLEWRLNDVTNGMTIELESETNLIRALL